MIAAQKQAKVEEKKIDERKPFKLNLGSKAARPTAPKVTGEEELNRSEPASPPDTAPDPTPLSNGQDNSSSPSLTDIELTGINHDSQPEKFNEKTVAQFKAAVKTVHEHVDDKGLIGDAIKNVLSMLEEHDFLKKIVQPQDIGMMVRGLRENYGVVIQKKQTRTTKRRAGAEEVEKIMADLSDIEIEI